MFYPSPYHPIAEDIEDIALGASVGYYLKANAEGRTGEGLVPSMKAGEPGYIPGTIGQITILHFLIPAILAIFFVPVLIIGALPFVGIPVLVHTLTHSPVYTGIAGGICGISYLYIIVWRIACRKMLSKMFKTLFG